MRVHDENDVMTGWTAYYGDGKVLTSENHKWVDIPVENFQWLKIHYDRNTDNFGGLNMYCITEDPDEIQKLIDEDPRNIKIGKRLDNKKYKKIEGKVFADKVKVKVMI